MPLKKLLKNSWLPVIGVLVLVNLVLFWQLYLKGLLPFPGDLLVSFFFPWYTGHFPGFNAFTTYKEWNGADAIRQMYPWKSFVADQLKSGQLPLWNPFNFSGYPLLANLQSSVFFPGTILYLFLPKIWAWISQVVLLPFIFGLGVFGFLRSQKLSPLASLFGAVVISNISYLTVWQEVLVVGQTILVLPFVLWAINSRRLATVPILLAVSIFGGHIQSAVYLYCLVFFYAIFQKISVKKIIFLEVLALGIAGIQLIPSLEAYLNSARDGQSSKILFATFLLPWKHLVTTLAPDFFGNPATRNYWSGHYGEWQTYFGVSALVFVVVVWFFHFKDRVVRFFTVVATLGVLLATFPLANIFSVLQIPVLSSSMPARIIFLYQFAMGVLAAIGFDFWWQNRDRFKYLPILVLVVIYGGIWGFVLTHLSDPDFLVTRNNLIIPTIVAFLIVGITVVRNWIPRLSKVFVVLIFGLAIFEYGYFFNKYHPFSPQKFVFPMHPMIQTLVNKAGINRFQGDGTSHFDKNFATYFQVYNPEGYDPIYPRRYGELMAAFKTGEVPAVVPRSDVDLDINGLTVDGIANKQRLLDILGVKYSLVTKNGFANVVDRPTGLPRVFLIDKYEVFSDSKHIIRRMYSSDFAYQNTLILEKDPKVFLSEGKGTLLVKKYDPMRVEIETEAEGNKLLFLSDNFFPGWKAKVDETRTEIYRADYSFRSVVVPSGKHNVTFIYDPESFKYGIFLTLISLGGWCLIAKAKKF
jgi:hypothetical protein